MLIGASTAAGAFTEAIVREMAKHCERPIIFPLSNPAPMAEATPADLIAWTEGRALIATGSPFQPVTYRGVTYVIGQVNNAMLYPGLCLGAIVSRARRISDNMFAAAANAVSSLVAVRLPGASLLPHVDDLRIVSLTVAVAVAEAAVEDGLAGVKFTDIVQQVGDAMWEPRISPDSGGLNENSHQLKTGKRHTSVRPAPLVRRRCSVARVLQFVAADTWIFQQRESHNLQRLLKTRLQRRVPPAAIPRGLIGRLEIPRLGLSAILIEGDDAKTLRRAVGHIPGTPLPGQPGNVAFSGHRDTFFRPLRNIRENDIIVVTTLEGEYRYRVVSTRIVAPDDMAVLNASEGEILTLVTCYPFYFVGAAPDRFIVRAERIHSSAQSGPGGLNL